MLVELANGKKLRGDLLLKAVLRSDCAAVPLTFEAEIRLDDSTNKQLLEGKPLKVYIESKLTAFNASEAKPITLTPDTFIIVHRVKLTGREAQGVHSADTIKITALLEQCHKLSFLRKRAVIKYNATLSEIYQACGATTKVIKGDFIVPRFCCLIGDTPTYHIMRVLQEAGGVVRWKNGKLEFFKNKDLFKQKPIMRLPNNTSNEADEFDSSFFERHKIPFFITTNPDGSILVGDNTKDRAFAYTPLKTAAELYNMTHVLIYRKQPRIYYQPHICGGDIIEIVPSDNYVKGQKVNPLMVVLTVAHVFHHDEHNTRLWLFQLEDTA